MKASHETSATNVASSTVARMHSFMIIAGIVTAIICSFILLKDFSSSQLAGTTDFDLINISKTTITDQAMNVVKVVF